MKSLSAILVLFSLSSCVQTDYVDDVFVPDDSMMGYTTSAMLRTGAFAGFSGTPVSGTARLELQSDQTVILKLDSNFTTTAGPSLYVYLSNSAGINSASLGIAALKSNSGFQSYILPSNVQLNSYVYVIIHCKPFNHTFGYAQFQ